MCSFWIWAKGAVKRSLKIEYIIYDDFITEATERPAHCVIMVIPSEHH